MITNIELTEYGTSLKLLDEAKKIELQEKLQGKTERFKLTCWVYLTRILWFAKYRKAINYEDNTAVAMVAKQSKESARKRSKDAATQGFLNDMKRKGFKVCVSVDKIREVEYFLEECGAVQVVRHGKGKVCEIHANLRVCALLLELLHPDWEWLEGIVGSFFNWLKGFCDGILGRAFNRKDEEGDVYEASHVDTDLNVFSRFFPTKLFDFGELLVDVRKLFRKYCWKSSVPRSPEEECALVLWDVELEALPF